MSTKTRNLGDVLQEFRQHRQLMQRELQKVIVGQDAVIEQIFAAIFTRGPGCGCMDVQSFFPLVSQKNIQQCDSCDAIIFLRIVGHRLQVF